MENTRLISNLLFTIVVGLEPIAAALDCPAGNTARATLQTNLRSEIKISKGGKLKDGGYGGYSPEFSLGAGNLCYLVTVTEGEQKALLNDKAVATQVGSAISGYGSDFLSKLGQLEPKWKDLIGYRSQAVKGELYQRLEIFKTADGRFIGMHCILKDLNAVTAADLLSSKYGLNLCPARVSQAAQGSTAK